MMRSDAHECAPGRLDNHGKRGTPHSGGESGSFSTLFVSNISYGVSKKCLFDLFVQIAPVRKLDYFRKIAFVEFDSSEHRRMAYDTLNGTELHGRRISMDLVEPETAVLVSSSLFNDTKYLQDVLSHFGSCRCQTEPEGIVCYYRKRTAADEAVRVLDGKSLLGILFTAKILPSAL